MVPHLPLHLQAALRKPPLCESTNLKDTWESVGLQVCHTFTVYICITIFGESECGRTCTCATSAFSLSSCSEAQRNPAAHTSASLGTALIDWRTQFNIRHQKDLKLRGNKKCRKSQASVLR